MRIYIPATLTQLAAPALTYERCWAPTERLVEFWNMEQLSDEEIQDWTMTLGAMDSLALNEPDSSTMPRIVIAADCSEEYFQETKVAGLSRRNNTLKWNRVASIHMDQEETLLVQNLNLRASFSADQIRFLLEQGIMPTQIIEDSAVLQLAVASSGDLESQLDTLCQLLTKNPQLACWWEGLMAEPLAWYHPSERRYLLN